MVLNTPPKTRSVVIITGGSRGIGAATSRLFAAHGFDVCINYRADAHSAHALVAELQQGSAKVIAVQADVSDEQQVKRLFNTVDEQLGTLDVLVNNAGIIAQQMRLQEMTAERIKRLLQTNILGPFVCCQQAVLRMSTALGGQGGCIVNVSSGAAKNGSPHEYIDYAATKGAVDTLTKGLAVEVAAEGIRVNAVRPGLIATQMHADGGEPDRISRLQSQIPLRRGGQAEEVAEAIYWLASDKSSYTTGTLLDITGGR
ncbi:glucose 1-dehydrogenase [Alteromonadaceae bacterium BrNp21-10]|nr:glucose 1-dehydrogenase [Alteromonadaceae bacterium BrNp21-10]